MSSRFSFRRHRHSHPHRYRRRQPAGRRAIAVLLLSAAAAFGAGEVKPAATNAAWESMKTLQGEWDGLYDGKVPTKASYRLVSNGTVLMETLLGADNVEMITMYHPDGARLVMTHYCSENNQPRMRAAAADPKRVVFRFLDVTNLPRPDAPRMTGLVVSLKDADHFTQEWTHSGHGASQTSTFAFTRKK